MRVAERMGSAAGQREPSEVVLLRQVANERAPGAGPTVRLSVMDGGGSCVRTWLRPAAL